MKIIFDPLPRGGNFVPDINRNAMKTLSKIRKILLILLVLPVFSLNVSGQKKIDSLKAFQDTSANVVVKFREGSQYVGRFRENKNDTLTIITADLGQICIPYNKIKSVQTIERLVIKKGKYWFPTPLPGRYYFAPSAFMLAPGEGYYQNTMIALNSFNVGVAKWFSIGGGVEFFTTIGSITAREFLPTFYLTPKIGFKVAKNLRIGAGMIYAQVLGSQFRIATGYGLITYGNADYNITAGLGLAYSQVNHGEWVWQKNPMITLCGTARLSRRLAFVTENWILPGAGSSGSAYAVFSYGLRIMGESMSVDLALINTKDIARVMIIGVPFVSFTVKF